MEAKLKLKDEKECTGGGDLRDITSKVFFSSSQSLSNPELIKGGRL